MRRRSLSFGVLLLLLGLFPLASYAEALESGLRDVVGKLDLHALEQAALRSFFTGAIGGDMFEKSKPDPDIFLTAARQLDLPPENCLVIEDSLNGLKAGRAAGMQVVYVKDVPSYSEEELDRYADYAFDQIEEAAELL